MNLTYMKEETEKRFCIKLLRYGSLLVSLLLPGFYIAMVMFHSEWIPDNLLRVIQNTEQQRPFTTAWEVLGLLIAYELIQEAGIHPHRLPSP